MQAEFEEQFAKIQDGEVPRPEMFGYSRLVRQVHSLEVAVTHMHQTVARNPNIPVPKGPETAYERWLRRREDDELDALFGDIFKANPGAFNGNRN